MYIRSLKELLNKNGSQSEALKKLLDKYGSQPEDYSPSKFELLVRDCAAVKYGQDFHLYGRSGQEQHGIDIFSDDWKILIQCKAYSPTKENYKKLKDEDITNCLGEAEGYFVRDGKKIFEQFIVATTLNTDTGAQDIEWKKGIDSKEATAEEEKKDKDEKVSVWFRNDLEEFIQKCQIHNDGDRYADEFNETLFLHKDKDKDKDKPESKIVNLKNLFVPQEYCEWNGSKFGNSRDDLEARIKRFCSSDDDRKLLIIEGDAGSGKSTLSAMLCNNAYENSRKVYEVTPGEEFPTDLLNGRPLLAIQLRKLKVVGDLSGNPEASILEHLNIKSQKEMDAHFPNAVFLLDGVDELCMQLKGTLNCERMIKTLCEWLPEHSKLILTSRPKYINISKLHSLSFSSISLQHFGRDKRQKWLNKYSAIFPGDSKAVNKDVADFILSSNDQNDPEYNLCDTPLMMYLLIGGKVTLEQTKNKWVLYHYLFSEAVVDTPHSEQWGARSLTEHPMTPEIGKLLYRITEEIAYKMYSAGAENPASNDLFVASSKAVQEVIVELLKDEHFRNDAIQAGLQNLDTRSFDLKRLHALCCYWRSDSADGPVEFYHKNIRDFFLCEKIRRELNTLYQMDGTDEEKTTAIAKRMIVLFKYDILNDTVLLFLREYARYAADEQKKQQGASPTREQEQRDVFFLKEQSHHLLPTLYQKMLTEGSLFDGLEMKDHIEAIRSVLRNTAVIYHRIYLSILTEKEKIRWWNDVDAVNENSMTRDIFPSCVRTIGTQSDLSKATLDDADLLEADLRGAHLTETHLREARIYEADITDANLNEADLTRAYLTEAYLSGAHLDRAHLGEAHLIKARLENAYLIGAHLAGAHLDEARLIRANLTGADFTKANLTKADLYEADLHGADLTGVDLRGAILPDGTTSEDQDAQIAHLKAMNIPGLKI